MLEKIAKWLTRKPKLVAMMAVLMLIPAAIGYISTRINYDILSYLPEDLESSHGEKLLEEPFNMAATSMLVVESMPEMCIRDRGWLPRSANFSSSHAFTCSTPSSVHGKVWDSTSLASSKLVFS